MRHRVAPSLITTSSAEGASAATQPAQACSDNSGEKRHYMYILHN